MSYMPDAETSRRHTMFLLFLTAAAVAFGIWQGDFFAGVFAFFALYLLAP